MKAQPNRPKFFDLAVPFFLPMWRRVAAAVVPVIWAFFEIANGEAFWGIIFLGLGGMATYKFITADWEAVAAQAEEEKRGR